ncbi:hypothetical protein BDP27DRAFT_1433148 [Rhodocollybia butyracea]|uniref:Uncharacterized protein n=1 Tax=Rhodocollybia butyracea TaxID=206335 RepID=A0A9P5P7R8_9AGAR|nr:hypothetical protein BDP27DRAFT_1433148 [Rhodocollybia butyracea]
MPRPGKRHCHCTPYCRSLVGPQTRNRHYKGLDGAEPFASSESESETPHYTAPDHISLLIQANEDSSDSDHSDSGASESGKIAEESMDWISNSRGDIEDVELHDSFQIDHNWNDNSDSESKHKADKKSYLDDMDISESGRIIETMGDPLDLDQTWDTAKETASFRVSQNWNASKSEPELEYESDSEGIKPRSNIGATDPLQIDWNDSKSGDDLREMEIDHPSMAQNYDDSQSDTEYAGRFKDNLNDPEIDSQTISLEWSDSESDHASVKQSSEEEEWDKADDIFSYDDTYLQTLALVNPWEKENFPLVNNILDKADINAIKMFKLNIKGWLTRQAFAGIRSLFYDELNLNSEWKTIQRMHQLAETEPQWYDCCMAYTGNYSELAVCQYCKEPRHNRQGKSRRQYCYIPLIPRIKGFFQNKSMIKLM